MTSLLLIAHGSSSIADAGDGLKRHAETIRRSGRFSAVAAAFLNGSPSILTAMQSLPEGPVKIVPIFIGAGHLSAVALPKQVKIAAEQLGRAMADLQILPPVGSSAAIADLALERSLKSAEENRLDPAHCVLILAGHGSSRSAKPSAHVRHHAARLQQERKFFQVKAGFLEEEPFLPDALAENSEKDVILVGVFTGEGAHVRDDVPKAVSAENARRKAASLSTRVYVAVMLGSDPAMAGIIAEFAQTP